MPLLDIAFFKVIKFLLHNIYSITYKVYIQHMSVLYVIGSQNWIGSWLNLLPILVSEWRELSLKISLDHQKPKTLQVQPIFLSNIFTINENDQIK